MERKLYNFHVYWPSEEDLDTKNEYVDLIINKEGKEYTGSLITLSYISRLFEKNRKTGENKEGSYLCLPNTIVVNDLENETIRKTLDDLIDKGFFNKYFD
jgi:hypothetical protein